MKIVQRLVVSLMLLIGMASQGAFAATVNDLSYNANGGVVGFSLPGLNSAGNPNFYTDANVSWINDRWSDTLTATSGRRADMFFTSGLTDGVANVYLVQNSSFELTARFDNAGTLLSGSLTIRGTLVGPDVSGRRTLVTADLSDVVFTDGMIGFNTINIKCRITGIECSQGESVYLSLANGGFSTDLRRYSSMALAVTTVPLPAAVLLFGGGLLGLAGISRRRKHGTQVALAT